MRTGKLSLENIITGLFIMLMGSVFLLCAQGYRTISDGKYHMFIIVCGGYCGVMVTARIDTALALSASAYLIQSMFSFSSCTTAPYFWITCAILIAVRSSMCAPGARK